MATERIRRVTVIHQQGTEAERRDPAVNTVAAAVAAHGARADLLEVKDDLDAMAKSLRERRPDLVFNLCRELASNVRLAPDVAAALDELGFPYTGAGPAGLYLADDREMQRRLLSAHGLPVGTDDAAEEGTAIEIAFVGNDTLDALPISRAAAPILETAAALGRHAWPVLRLRDYGVVTCRVGATGDMWIASIEANPSLALSGSVATAARRAGVPYERLIARILDEAWSRRVIERRAAQTPPA